MKLELYKRDTCPYCMRVMSFIDTIGADVEMHDISRNAADRERLVAVGGKQQVPCLLIDGKPLYESADIIAWLKANA